MAQQRMTIKEMIRLCIIYAGVYNGQVQVIAHEVYKEYEYIDFYNLREPHPRPRHRIRKFNGQWMSLY